MAVLKNVGVSQRSPPSRSLDFTRQEVKNYIDKFEITAVEKITKVFGGLPCRTVKVFPLPDDFEPSTMEDFFSDVPGHVVATLTFTENHTRAMFVSFSLTESVQFALNKNGQSIGSSLNEFKVNVEVLPDTEFLKFLHEIVNESCFLLHGEKKRNFQHPDLRGITLSEELDIYLSVLRSTLHREKQKADEEEKAKEVSSIAGYAEPLKEECSCQNRRKPNKFETAYTNEKVKEPVQVDHLPKRSLPRPNRVQRLKEWKRTPRFGYLTFGALVVTALAGCFLFQRMCSRVGGIGVIAETKNFVQ